MKQRESNGQFAKGNSGGPGRGKRTTEIAYLTAMSDTVSIDDWQAICQRAVKDARNGEWRARQWLSEYLLRTDISLIDIAAQEAAGLDPVQAATKKLEFEALIAGL